MDGPLQQELRDVRSGKLLAFANQQFLADCTVTTADGKEFKAHRVVLAAASELWYREMRGGDLKDKYEVPEPLAPKFSPSVLRPSDVFPTVLRFAYSNQDAATLTEEALNKSTALQLLSLAHILEMPALADLTAQYISTVLLNDSNGPELLYEALKYESVSLAEAALKKTAANFGEIVKSGKGLEAMIALPLETVQKCLEREDVVTPSEGTVFAFVCAYVQKREDLPRPAPEEGEAKVPPSEAPKDPIADPSKPPTPQETAEKILTPRFLSDGEKLSLFSSVRYPFLSHSELLQAASNPLVAVAKDLVLEGLSVQLSTRSGEAPGYRYRVNRTARVSYSKKTLLSDHRSSADMFVSDRGGFASDNTEEEAEGLGALEVRPDLAEGEYWQEEPRDPPLRKTSHYISPSASRPQMAATLPHRRTPPREQSPPRPPQKWPKNSKYALESPIRPASSPVREFTYQYDFDDNGAFFYLGSLGKTRAWENPHLINQVKAFASSVGAGRIEDLVGRSVTLLRTDDEANSYFGVDLGPGRLLLPTAYTIRNRNSTSHVMLNWQLEGSIDRAEWKVLDRRLHFTGDAAFDSPLEEEREMLKQKGATSTWGVGRERLKSDQGEAGFRYLRIVQIERNSSGSFNLGLSGLEVYGVVIAGRWP